ncbi:MAG: 5'/3'-nucleotidase SurE [Chloroflexi bacterium]|nr:5'/3'-nucleotidase SurE [Chloroflexota bacterium]
MYILVTNDDGIDSEGLLVLKQALEQVAEVVVVAPARNWSVAGHTKSLDKPLRVTEIRLADGYPAYSVEGTPSDCVSLAVLGMLQPRPDLVVAGINKGPNLGDDITYSGTVAAAMEGVIAGIPSVAISLADYFEWDFTYAAHFAAGLAQHMGTNGLAKDVLLNVNVPAVPRDQIASVEITRLGKRVYHEVLTQSTDPSGHIFYSIGGELPSGIPEEGTDFKAIVENRISITPIHLDLTNHHLIEHLRRWELHV